MTDYSCVAAAEPVLWELSEHMGLTDAQLERLSDALDRLNAAESEGGEAHRRVLLRFKGDYAQLRTWAGRGRRDRMEKMLNAMLDNALNSKQ
jgi:hypothetical protein